MSLQTVKILKALADETRVEIVRQLLPVKQMSCQDLMKRFSLSQPTLSHHFNKLVSAGILESEKDGVLWIYKLRKDHLKDLGIDVKKLVASN